MSDCQYTQLELPLGQIESVTQEVRRGELRKRLLDVLALRSALPARARRERRAMQEEVTALANELGYRDAETLRK